MRALVIICPSLGIGEIFTAIKLAERLSENGNEIHFVGTSTIDTFSFIKMNNHTILTMDSEKNSIVLEIVINEFNPDLVIFTDYHMYKKNIRIKDIFDLDSLQRFNIPFYIIDTLGDCTFHDENVSLYDTEASIEVPSFVNGLLRPVPQHDPKINDNSYRTRYFSVFDSKLAVDINGIRKSLGLDLERQTVVLTLGKWVKSVTSQTKFKLYLSLIRVVLYYLNKIEIKLEVVILGECNFEYKEFQNLKINKNLVNLSFEDTDMLIQSASLLITLNRFSNSLCRAVCYNIPCMALVNSNRIDFSNKNIEKHMPYEISNYVNKILKLISLENMSIDEYMVFPESNKYIFERFFKENPMYSNVVPHYEIFDENTIISIIKDIIFLKSEDLKIKQKDFMEQTSLLPSPTKILKELNYGVCSTGR